MSGKGRPALLKREYGGRDIISTVIVAVAAVVLVILLVGIWFRSTYVAYQIVGPSMRNTLASGDWVYGKQGAAAERGDVVIVDVSDHTQFRDDDTIIKRLIAVEGDTVRCSGGVVYLRRGGGEEERLEEPYTTGATNDFEAVTLGAGEVYVMGDNRTESYDSRKVGPLRYRQIVAVVPEWTIERRASIGVWEEFRQDVRNFFGGLFREDRI